MNTLNELQINQSIKKFAKMLDEFNEINVKTISCSVTFTAVFTFYKIEVHSKLRD